MEKIEQRIIARLGFSIICTELGDESKIWPETTCQDVLHSIFCLRRDIQEMLDEFLCYQEDDIDSKFFEKDVIAKTMQFVAQVLRPFGLKWHAIFFSNTEFSAVHVTSIPKEYIDLTYRARFC